MEYIPGYDTWKLDTPPWYDYEDTPQYCVFCDDEIISDEECNTCEQCQDEIDLEKEHYDSQRI